MKKPNKNLRLIISTSLILAVIGSIAIPVFADSNVISDSLSKVENALHVNPHAQKIERKEEPPQTITQNITTPLEHENPIDAIKAKAAENRKHRLHQQDEYNYVQKDVEELLLSGATLEDIYRSDEIGNQWLVNPSDLIKSKHEGKQTWDDIEITVTDQKEKQLKMLLKKHAGFENKFSNQEISTAEKLEILQHIESNPDQTPDDVIASFQTEGLQGLQKLHDKNPNAKGGK